jgi:uncharacterized protein YmfQ (DUF2313 family)
MATAADYLGQLKALLPQGAAWPRESGSTLSGLLEGLAEELARVDGRAGDLMVQTDPRAVTEMLGDWERAYGLPDGCVVAEPTEAGRRLALHQRVASLGGQSPAYYVGLSALLGYEAEAESFRPSRLPLTLPTPLAGRPWAFAWRVVVYGPAEIGAEAPIYAAADLECVISRIRPAHTVVAFDFDPDPAPTLHFDFLNPPD